MSNLDTSAAELSTAITNVLSGVSQYAVFTHFQRTPSVVVHKEQQRMDSDSTWHDEFWNDFLQEDKLTYAYVRLHGSDDEATRFLCLSNQGANVGIVFKNKFVFFQKEFARFMDGKCHDILHCQNAPLDLHAIYEQLAQNNQGLFVTSTDGRTKRMTVSEAIAAAKDNAFSYSVAVRSSTKFVPPPLNTKKPLTEPDIRPAVSAPQSDSPKNQDTQDQPNHDLTEHPQDIRHDSSLDAQQEEIEPQEEPESDTHELDHNSDNDNKDSLAQEEQHDEQERLAQEAAEKSAREEQERQREQQEQLAREEELKRIEEERILQQQEAERLALEEQQEAEGLALEEQQELAEKELQQEEDAEHIEEQTEGTVEKNGDAICTGVAQWDFATDDPEELSFKRGDTLNILRNEGDWMFAELNGQTGFVPANYVVLDQE